MEVNTDVELIMNYTNSNGEQFSKKMVTNNQYYELSVDGLELGDYEYEISVKEIILNEDEILFKGSPIYLKDNKGLETETSMVKLKSNGELIFPSKLNIKNY